MLCPLLIPSPIHNSNLPPHTCALVILVASGTEMSRTTNAFKFSPQRQSGKCLSLVETIFRHPVLDKQATSPQGKVKEEKKKESPFVKSIHFVVTWKLSVVPLGKIISP